MSCKTINVNDLARDYIQAWERAAEQVGHEVYACRPVFREQVVDGHIHYTLQCQRGEGGTLEAEAAVREHLPSAVYCSVYDEVQFDRVLDAILYAIALAQEVLDCQRRSLGSNAGRFSILELL
jgi:hypothetical protein